jgi:hypothetical protein
MHMGTAHCTVKKLARLNVRGNLKTGDRPPFLQKAILA